MNIEKLYRASSCEDALKTLKEDPKNVIVGGGTWLKLTGREIKTAILLDDLSLDTISTSDDVITIGAMTPLHKIEQQDELRTMYDGLFDKTLKQVMGVGLRNMATIGGTIAGRYGFSDIITSLLAMDARVVFYQKGEMQLETFLKTRGKLDDLLISVKIPRREGRGFFKKVATTQLDFAQLNLAITKSNEATYIVIGSRPGIAQNASKAARFVVEQKHLDDSVIKVATDIALNEVTLSSNNKASSSYRERLARTYIERGLKAVFNDES